MKFDINNIIELLFPEPDEVGEVEKIDAAGVPLDPESPVPQLTDRVKYYLYKDKPEVVTEIGVDLKGNPITNVKIIKRYDNSVILDTGDSEIYSDYIELNEGQDKLLITVNETISALVDGWYIVQVSTAEGTLEFLVKVYEEKLSITKFIFSFIGEIKATRNAIQVSLSTLTLWILEELSGYELMLPELDDLSLKISYENYGYTLDNNVIHIRLYRAR